MKVWLALTGLVCAVGGQYSEGIGHSAYETHRTPAQYRVVEQAQSGGSDNGYLSSGISVQGQTASAPVGLQLAVSPHGIPVQHPVVSLHGLQTSPSHVQVEQYDPHPEYTYSYGVHVPNGDVKGHTETRHGDVVRGSYSVMEADGTMRIVDYTADPIHGFNAVVRNTPVHSQVAVQAPVAQHTTAVYPAQPYVLSQISSNPTSTLSTNQNQPPQYAPSTQPQSASNEISYSISYQTPQTTQPNNRYQYAVEQNNNAHTLNRLPYSTNQQSQGNAQSDQSSQSNPNQQTSYYHFRMIQNQPSNSQQSAQQNQSSNQATNSQGLVANNGYQQTSYSNGAHNTNNSPSINRPTIDNQSLFGLVSYSNQRTNNQNQLSSNRGSSNEYLTSHATVTAYPTATPANIF